MFRLLSCLLALQVATAQVAPVPGVVPPVVPPYPYSGAGLPGVPGARSPYYNTAAGSAPIVAYSSEPPVEGTYAFNFATADGKQAQENGFLKDAFIDNAGEPQGTQVVQGSYSYISPEGTPIQVSYVADENGFRPSGVHIPADGTAAARLPVPSPLNPLNPLNPALEGYRNDPRRPFDARYNNPYYRNSNTYDRFNPYKGARGYNGLYNGVQGPYNGPNGAYNGLNGAYNGINGAYNGLNAPYNGLNGAYNGLNGAYNGLNGAYNGLNGAYNGLNAPYNGINGAYNAYNRGLNGYNGYNNGYLNQGARYSGYPYNEGYNYPRAGAWNNVAKDRKDVDKKD